MNDGPRHDELRPIVERLLASWNLSELDTIVRIYATSEPIEHIAPLTAGAMIGIEDPKARIDDILAFTSAVAFDAGAAAIERGIAAAPRLRAELPAIQNEDEAANLLGFLFQTTAATTRLIRLQLENKDEPPAPFTRRWPKEGGDEIRISLERRHFGAGPHQCPGRAIAERIASAAVDVLRRRTDV
ncbi:MAG TPA: hypothetical protein VFL13_11340 [Candidatus Baltobacteraceae bacterium]|nr:hypothetical protein [Candidatus Baltobacteraceae bacterium]